MRTPESGRNLEDWRWGKPARPLTKSPAGRRGGGMAPYPQPYRTRSLKVNQVLRRSRRFTCDSRTGRDEGCHIPYAGGGRTASGAAEAAAQCAATWRIYCCRLMLDRGSPFRVFVSLLLAVTIPLCCCSFRSWLGGQSGCHGGRSLVESAAAPNDALPACHRHAQAKGPGEDGTDTSPGSPGGPTEEPDGPCTCGKHYTGTSGIEKPGADLSPPVLVAVLPIVAPDLTGAALAVRTARHGHVPLRPQTSLLRLHCALVV